jgi:hypothetical protein
MNDRQRRTLEALKRRVVARTCHSRVAEITKADTDQIGGNAFFHIHAESGIFKGTAIGYIGPRGGIHMTHERYDFY